MVTNTVLAFASGATTNVIEPPPGGDGTINSAEIVLQTSAPGYSQTQAFYYLQPVQARQLANTIEYSTVQSVMNYFVSIFGVLGLTWSTAALIDGLYRTDTANRIRSLSESGPVCVIYSNTPYGNFIDFQSWDGRPGSIDTSTHDYWENGYHYVRSLISSIYNI